MSREDSDESDAGYDTGSDAGSAFESDDDALHVVEAKGVPVPAKGKVKKTKDGYDLLKAFVEANASEDEKKEMLKHLKAFGGKMAVVPKPKGKHDDLKPLSSWAMFTKALTASVKNTKIEATAWATEDQLRSLKDYFTDKMKDAFIVKKAELGKEKGAHLKAISKAFGPKEADSDKSVYDGFKAIYAGIQMKAKTRYNLEAGIEEKPAKKTGKRREETIATLRDILPDTDVDRVIKALDAKAKETSAEIARKRAATLADTKAKVAIEETRLKANGMSGEDLKEALNAFKDKLKRDRKAKKATEKVEKKPAGGAGKEESDDSDEESKAKSPKAKAPKAPTLIMLKQKGEYAFLGESITTAGTKAWKIETLPTDWKKGVDLVAYPHTHETVIKNGKAYLKELKK